MLPIVHPPIAGGWVEVGDDGRIVRVGTARPPGAAEDLGDVALLPGLVNAHTHLELSWMAGRVEPTPSMVEWIRRLLAERSKEPAGGRAGADEALARAVTDVRASGTVLVGDISNALGTRGALDALGLGGVIFHEVLGFSAPDPAALVRDAWARADRLEAGPEIGVSVVAHAPYSVSPALFQAIAASRRAAPLSVHLGESAEEVEFVHTGRGPFRALLEELGVWTDAWPVPRCGPAEYLRRLGYLQPGCLVVHGVHLDAADREIVRDANAVLVACPRSNAWVGAGLPAVSRFYADGLRVAIGTDSLASVGSLSVFDELAELRRIAPEVDAARLLESATRIGAEALGRGADFGTLAPGMRAVFAAVEVPAAVTDVEEYLVSGVPASAVRLIGSDA
jgi:cytosine/adenosine deaminase-related metal-dependent hydrolase